MLRSTALFRPRYSSAARFTALGCALLAALGGGGCASVDPAVLEQILGGGAALDEATVAAGLREALRVGTDRTVESTSRFDGFLGNPRIRIPLPESLQPVADGLRRVGLDEPVDELEIAMNRAAERAATEAAAVFVDRIRQMTLSDAFAILEGSDTAATEYFRRTTGAELESRFRPIVARKLSEVGVYRAWGEVTDRWNALPLTSPPEFDPDAYVTARALDGLFTILGDEEMRIREDPLARTTALLKRVFGAR